MHGVLTFGVFELDLGNCELRRGGIAVQLQPQPFKVLSLLVRNSGRLVSRDEIRVDVWGPAAFLGFDQSLNYCIRQIRSALNDDVSVPHYIETRQRLGYRFVAPVAEYFWTSDRGKPSRRAQDILRPQSRKMRDTPKRTLAWRTAISECWISTT